MKQTKRSNAVVTVETIGAHMAFTVAGCGTVTLDLNSLSQPNQQRALIHGMKQRISDAAAIPCDPDTGLPATPAEKFEAISALVEHYNSGTDEWARVRAAGDGSLRTGQTLTAFANVYYEGDMGKAEVTMLAFETKRGIDRKAALKIWAGSDKIIAEVARMKAEQATTVDADDLLAELEG